MTEILDLVDNEDNVIGTINRDTFQDSLEAGKPLGNIRVTDGFLQNSRGQLWIPRRTANKRLAPNGLDFSVGEHVQASETYQQAILRGFKEELNLNLKPADLEFRIVLKHDDISVFSAVFVYKTDKTPEYNPDDFSDFEWLTPKEVVTKIEAGDLAKPNLLPTLRSVFGV